MAQDNWSSYRAELEKSILLVQYLKIAAEGGSIDCAVLTSLFSRMKELESHAAKVLQRGQEPEPKKTALVETTVEE